MKDHKLKKLLVGIGVLLTLAIVVPGVAEARDDNAPELKSKRLANISGVEDLCDSLGGDSSVQDFYSGGWSTFSCYDEDGKEIMFCAKQYESNGGREYWECFYTEGGIPAPREPITGTKPPSGPVLEPTDPGPPYQLDMTGGGSLQAAN